MSSISGPIDPTDLANVSPPFDQTVSGVSPTTALVELRGDNGLLLPCVRNPKEASAGAVTFVGITSLDGDHGATYAGGSVVVSAGASLAVVNHGELTPAGIDSTSRTVTLSFAPTAGNFLLVCVGGGSATTTCTDNKSNTYRSNASVHLDPGSYMSVFWKENIAGGSDFQITVTGIAAWADINIGVVEVSGVLTSGDPLDQYALTADMFDCHQSDLTPTTTQANEIVFGFVQRADGADTFTQGTGYTILGSFGTIPMGLEYKTVSSTGQQQSTWTHSGTAINLGHICLTFKAAS